MSLGKVKQVLVSVNESGVVVCSPATATIKGSNVQLSFQLQTAGYAFPASNAVVVTNPGTQFPYPSWTVNAVAATLYDANTDVGDYAYTVSVVEVSTGALLTLDPTIRNES